MLLEAFLDQPRQNLIVHVLESLPCPTSCIRQLSKCPITVKANSIGEGITWANCRNQVALLTARRLGIGASIAINPSVRQKARRSWSTTPPSRTGADRVVSEIKAQGGKAIAVQPHVAKARMCSNCSQKPRRHKRRLEVLVKTQASMILLLSIRLPRNNFIAAVRHECVGTRSRHPGSRQAFQQRWRQRDQHRVCREFPDAADHGLYRDQECGGCCDTNAGEGTRTEEDPRELHQSRHGGNRGVSGGGFLGSDFQKGAEIANAPRLEYGSRKDVTCTRPSRLHRFRRLRGKPYWHPTVCSKRRPGSLPRYPPLDPTGPRCPMPPRSSRRGMQREFPLCNLRYVMLYIE